MSKTITEARIVLRDSGAFLGACEVQDSIDRCRDAVDRMFAEPAVNRIYDGPIHHPTECYEEPTRDSVGWFPTCHSPKDDILYPIEYPLYPDGWEHHGWLTAYDSVSITPNNLEAFCMAMWEGIEMPKTWQLENAMERFFLCISQSVGQDKETTR